MLVCDERDCTSAAVLDVPTGGGFGPHCWTEQHGRGLVEGLPVSDAFVPRLVAFQLLAIELTSIDAPKLP
jgi:hypothetical protein